MVAEGAAAIEIKPPHGSLRQPQEGCTALWFAAANGHIDCLRLLIDSGANINAENIVRESVRIFVSQRMSLVMNSVFVEKIVSLKSAIRLPTASFHIFVDNLSDFVELSYVLRVSYRDCTS